MDGALKNPNVGDNHHQMALPLAGQSDQGRDSFIVAPSNALAVQLINKTKSWHNATALIVGPPMSGKTHLLRVYARENAVMCLSASSLYLSYSAPVLVLDGLEAIIGKPKAQECLFHLLNRALVGEIAVLIASRKPLSALPIALPDLASRLAAASSALITEPEEELLAQILTKHFADAQVEVRRSVVEFLANRIDRTYEAAARAVAVINSLALAERRAITVPLVKNALDL